MRNGVRDLSLALALFATASSWDAADVPHRVVHHNFIHFAPLFFEEK